jgi:FkbM family methyltransferase
MRRILYLLYKTAFKILSGYGIGKKLHIFEVVRTLNSFIIPRIKPDFTEVQGHKMFLDSRDSLGLSIFGVHEPLTTEIVKKEVRKGNTVIDIGANIGYYTLIFASLVGENGKVIAFEPDPTNFTILKKNVEINGYQNVTLIQKAVSNETNKVKLYLHNSVENSIVEINNGHPYIEIDTVRLDDYLDNNNLDINLIKIDIEGAEGKALQGMTHLLEKNRAVKIITEFRPIALEQSGICSEEFLKLLMELGFKLYEINEQEKEIIPVNTSKLLERYTPEKEDSTNLLCVR